jgi:hypothetical protein
VVRPRNRGAATVSATRDFWLSCGHHLLDRDADGWLSVTDEFIKLYLARPELGPPPDAGTAEQSLHTALLSEPWRPVAPAEIEAIADGDVRENWHHMIAFRGHLAVHRTLEETYLAIQREKVRVPPIFINQMVHLILRNALDQCEDAYVLRAAELFFRPQRLTLHEGSLLAADQQHLDSDGPTPSPLAMMFGLQEQPDVTVLSETNAQSYWERSDRFDLALDLTAGRRGLAALGTVIERWVKHLLKIDIVIEPVIELREIVLEWYVGLDAYGTKIGDALWHGAALDDATRNTIVGLFRLAFRDPDLVMPRIAGRTVYLILAMAPDMSLSMKPQNLLTGLPLPHLERAI